MTARPIYVACLGIAVMGLWSWYVIPGALLVAIAGCMEP